jgi:putative FmdB family regulatory protein
MPSYEYLCDTCGRTADHIRPRQERDHPARCGAHGCKGHLALQSAPAIAIDKNSPPR